MAHFQLDQELQSALRLDTSINVGSSSSSYKNKFSHQILNGSSCDTPGRSRSRSNSSFLNISRNASTSRLLNTVSSSLGANTVNNGAQKQQRSHSASRLTPSKLMTGSASLSCSRPNSPSRQLNSSALPPRAPSASRCGAGDRFIPNRSTTDLDMAHYAIIQAENNSTDALASNNYAANNSDQENEEEALSITDRQRRKQTANILLNNKAGDSRILSFKTKAPAADEAHVNSLKVLYSTGKPKVQQAAKMRQVSSRPDKILDAPDLIDDFYLHLLDWSVNNHLAVALVNSLFVWNAGDGSITELFVRENNTETITAVSWIPEGNILAVGDGTGSVELWDVTRTKQLRTMRGHTDRVPVLGWNAHVLASGCRNGQVWLHDVRVAQHHIATLAGHTQEVCGMAWSPENGRLLATGSNDNLVHLWDARSPDTPVITLNAHLAAVKALSWCPWQPRTLATGGGTTDRTIKFWNSASGNLLQSVDTGSQVSAIVWNEEYKELVTGHGFTHNQIVAWKYPSMTKVADLRGHTSRVLLLLKSPDGTTVASAAADETIRLWKIWPQKDKKMDKKKSKEPVSLFTQQSIR